MAKRLDSGSGKLVIDTVSKVEQIEDGWLVATQDGATHTADSLILATPADITAALLDPVEFVPKIEVRNASVLFAYHLDAVPKDHYAHHVVHIFNEKTPIIFIARRNDGTYEIFTEIDFEVDGGKNMDEYFEEWEVLGKKYWPKALFTNPNIVTNQNPAPGLILAGDQNGLGMEPAAISGVYAANKIIGKTID